MGLFEGLFYALLSAVLAGGGAVFLLGRNVMTKQQCKEERTEQTKIMDEWRRKMERDVEELKKGQQEMALDVREIKTILGRIEARNGKPSD